MSQLARAFTTISRRNKKVDDASADDFASAVNPHIGRAASQRAGRPVDPNAISSPMALVSTSNMQVHNAKHIAGTNVIQIQHVGHGIAPANPGSSASSNASVSGDESDVNTGAAGSSYMTDASSIDESPTPSEPEPNHLSCYFKPSVDTTLQQRPSFQRSRSSTTSSSAVPVSPAMSSSMMGDDSEENSNTPRLPQRVPSHSKRAHERVHRTRSMQRIIAPPLSRSTVSSSGHSITSSASSFVEAPRESTAFGNELAQLDEVAEEFGMAVSKTQSGPDAEESAFLAGKGLAVYGVEVYAAEIAALVAETFGCVYPSQQEALWI